MKKRILLFFFTFFFVLGCFPTEDKDIASDCSLSDLEGIWKLTNQSTYTYLTINSSGTVTAAVHPHGVIGISGEFTITNDCMIDGWYELLDDENYDNTEPTPPGTYYVILDGYMKTNKTKMELDYTMNYTPEGGATETYDGVWQAEKQ